MKRLIFFLITIPTYLLSFAQSQSNEAFYIYRNDGQFNAFFRDDVQSIEYSNYDADGDYHDQIVSQIINTADSVYKIPLANIDSIAFDVNKIKVSPDYISVPADEYLVEKADTLNGYYQIRFTQKVPLLHEGDIISVANDTLAQIVRISTITHIDDMCISIQSQHVSLGEVFTGGSFTLSTEMENSEAKRTSPYDRVFHPIEVSFYDDSNKLHRVRRNNANYTYRLYNKTIDYSGHELYKTEHTKLYAEKCNFKFALDLVISCNFSNKNEPTNLHREGNLQLVKSVVRGKVDTDFMLRFDASASKEVKTDEIMLKANIHKPIVATFVVAGVPIAVMMNTHLYGEYSFNASGNFSAHTGHTTSTTAEMGLSWSQTMGVKPYGSIDGTFDFHKPTIEGDAHLEGKFSVFPRITFSLYGLVGPTFDIKPYVRPVLGLGFYDQIGTNADDYYGAEYDLFAGYDASVGISELSVLGKKPSVMSPSWNVIDKMLLEVPKKIEFVNSKPDALKLGQTMNVTFHAMDYDYIQDNYINEILPFPVKFVTNSGTLSSDFALVNPETGLVSIEWTPDAWKVDGKDAYILALMYTPDGHVKTADRWTPSIIEVNPKSFVEVITNSITSTSAQLEYGFTHIPKDAVCNVAIQAKDEVAPIIYQVQSTERDTLLALDLHPETTYNYWTFVEYMGKTYMNQDGKKTFVTLTPSAYVKDAEEVTTTTAQVEYGFYNVPKEAECYMAIKCEGEETIHSYSVPATEKDFYVFADLKPSTKYTFWAYIEYDNMSWSSNKEFLTTQMPVATTGNNSNVTTNSAIIICSYENVPEGATCGVEYFSDNSSHRQTTSNENGTQTIALNGLKSGTTYTYRAYIEDDGQMYYGEEKTFTTKYEIPDITGVWHCIEYQNGQETGSVTFELKEDKTVISTNADKTCDFYTNKGKWSIKEDGTVYIGFNYSGSSFGASKSYNGKINSFNNPSQIEGASKFERVTNMQGHYTHYEYDFIMSR